MREAEKREFKDEKLIKDFLRKKGEDHGELTVEKAGTSDESDLIRLSNSEKTETRKEHTFPEYLRTQGD